MFNFDFSALFINNFPSRFIISLPDLTNFVCPLIEMVFLSLKYDPFSIIIYYLHLINHLLLNQNNSSKHDLLYSMIHSHFSFLLYHFFTLLLIELRL